MSSGRLILTLALVAFTCACNKTGSQSPSIPASDPQTAAKRYHLKGKVVSVDKLSGSVNVDAEAIPGFMGAMAMDYAAKPASQLDQLSPGDSITADVVEGSDGYWLENITVTAHGSAPAAKPTSELHVPSPGELVPDFALINQSGKRITLDQYRGKALLVTFIYTRCPFPDYCPRVSGEFAKINRALPSNPALRGRVHLLSISFDPAHDTAKVLRDYGFSCAGSRQPQLFKTWEFAVVPSAGLAKIANYFGLAFNEENGLITHSLSTTVIGPDGKVVHWYYGNDWQADDLIKDAESALRKAA